MVSGGWLSFIVVLIAGLGVAMALPPLPPGRPIDWSDEAIKSIALSAVSDCGRAVLKSDRIDRAVSAFASSDAGKGLMTAAANAAVLASRPGAGTATGGSGRSIDRSKRHVMFVSISWRQHFTPIYNLALELVTKHSDKFIVSILCDSVAADWIKHPSIHVLPGGTDTPLSLARYATGTGMVDAGCLSRRSALGELAERDRSGSGSPSPVGWVEEITHRIRLLSQSDVAWSMEWLAAVANQTARVTAQTLSSLSGRANGLLPHALIADAQTYGAFTAAELHSLPVIVNHPQLAAGVGVPHTAFAPDFSVPFYLSDPKSFPFPNTDASASHPPLIEALKQFYYYDRISVNAKRFAAYHLNPAIRTPYGLSEWESGGDAFTPSSNSSLHVQRLVLLNSAIGFEWSRPTLPALVQWTGPLTPAPPFAHSPAALVPSPAAYALTGSTVSYQTVRDYLIATVNASCTTADCAKCVYIELGAEYSASRAFVSTLLTALANERCVLWQIANDQRHITLPVPTALTDAPARILFGESLPRELLFGAGGAWNLSGTPPANRHDRSNRVVRGSEAASNRDRANLSGGGGGGGGVSDRFATESVIDLVISECDVFSTQSALLSALPVLCLPHAGDQFDVASRLAAARAGIVRTAPGLSVLQCPNTRASGECDSLSSVYSVSELQSDLAALRNRSDGSYRARALDAGIDLQSGGGVNRAFVLLIFAIEHNLNSTALHHFLNENYSHRNEPPTGAERYFVVTAYSAIAILGCGLFAAFFTACALLFGCCKRVCTRTTTATKQKTA